MLKIIGAKRKTDAYFDAKGCAEFLRTHIDWLIEYDSKHPEYLENHNNAVGELKELQRIMHRLTNDLEEL